MVLGALSLAALGPPLISTKPGLNATCAVINAFSKLKIDADVVKAGWRTKNPVVHGLRVTDDEKNLLFTAERLYASKTLWEMLSTRRSMDSAVTVIISKPVIYAHTDDAGEFIAAKAFHRAGIHGPIPLGSTVVQLPPVIPKPFISLPSKTPFSAEMSLKGSTVLVSEGILVMPTEIM